MESKYISQKRTLVGQLVEVDKINLKCKFKGYYGEDLIPMTFASDVLDKFTGSIGCTHMQVIVQMETNGTDYRNHKILHMEEHKPSKGCLRSFLDIMAFYLSKENPKESTKSVFLEALEEDRWMYLNEIKMLQLSDNTQEAASTVLNRLDILIDAAEYLKKRAAEEQTNYLRKTFTNDIKSHMPKVDNGLNIPLSIEDLKMVVEAFDDVIEARECGTSERDYDDNHNDVKELRDWFKNKLKENG